MAELILDKKAVIAQLVRSPHGKLLEYAPMGSATAVTDPEFMGHLIAWNHQKGQIRDSKVALPVIALATPLPRPMSGMSATIYENALAHLADLTPRMFLQALEFAREIKAPSRLLRRLTARYLRDLEADGRDWERTALRHRGTLRTLYGRAHLVPGGPGRGVSWQALKQQTALDLHAYGMDRKLMARKPEGKFAILRTLKELPATAVADTIARSKLPFLAVRGALGPRTSEPEILMALMGLMSPTELVTSTKMLKRLGVLDNAITRAAFEKAIEKAGKKPRKGTGRNTLKTTTAAEVLEQDEDAVSGRLATKLRALQETQLDHLKTIEGDWLILADMSHSMHTAIEVARQISSVLARTVKGKVHFVAFNTTPRYLDATGMSYEALVKATGLMNANGGTIIGIGLDYIVARKIAVDGICIVSDGGHNAGASPTFPLAYQKYVKTLGNEPTVYFYQTPGDPDYLTPEMQRQQIAMETFDLRKDGVHGKIDRYSLPDLVMTMRASRYSLLDEIYDAPFRTVDEVLTRTVGMEVLRGEIAVRA